MQYSNKITIFGELLIDHKIIQGKKLPPASGGPPFYLNSVLKDLKSDVNIITHHGVDLPTSFKPAGAKLIPEKPSLPHNPRYFLTYSGTSRTLSINDRKFFKPVLPEHLAEKQRRSLKNSKLTFFCATLPVYPPALIAQWQKYFPNAYTILLAQGWMRQANKNNKIIKRNPNILLSWFSRSRCLFDAIIFSEEDHDPLIINSLIRTVSPKTIIAVTKGINGASIYHQRKMIDLPTDWPIREKEGKPLDTTGAGDRWAGIFSYQYFISKSSIYQAVKEAHRLTAYFIKISQIEVGNCR